ncbi:MAG: hypothetical protein O7D91_06030 [Planctomycetota bacterium]|nr:hypothetical protein [Planctomycetota bacterium]
MAIIRPGAANQGKKEKFVRRHQGFEPPEYAHPIVEPILKQTYGLMVFEEHILQVATEFAGLNLGAADVLRRALNKQKASMIRTMKREFYASARIQWRCEEDIDTVWGLLEGFSGFMFNKAHSAEYAVEAFQGAWLKRRWPAHYIAAILSNYRGFYAHSPTLPQILYVLEALRLGIGILPPCINRSRQRFSVCYMDNADEKADRQPPIRDATVRERSEITNYELRITKSERAHSPSEQDPGLAATRRGARSNAQSPTERSDARAMIRLPVSHIKGLSAKLIERHLAERGRGPFANLDDFLERCRPTASEAQLLLDAGALDNLGHSRPELFWRLRTDAHDTTPEQPILWHANQSQCGTATIRDRSGITNYELGITKSTSDHSSPVRNPGLAATRRGARLNADCGVTSASSVESRIADCRPLPPVELTEPDIYHIAQREMDLLGFPISVDPWTHLSHDEHGRTIDWSRYVPIDRLHCHFGRRVQVCGLMVADRVDRTQRGNLMKFVTLGDRTGFVEAILFPNVYQRFGYLTAANPILAATGIVEPFENRNGFTLRVQSVAVPARGRSNEP